MSINKVLVSGRLTRDAELGVTRGGTAVSSFGFAVNDRVKNQQTGEWEDSPNFVECVMFGKRAEALNRYLHKGTQAFIEGHLHYSSWEKDGVRKSRLEIIVDSIDLASNSKSNAGAQPVQQETYADVEMANEDIPF